MVKQKKILLRCADDSVMVMSFITDDEHGLVRVGTPSEIDAEISKSSSAWSPSKLPIVSWHEITDDDIPPREFREAWVVKDKKIDHDMKKARSIHLDRIRAKRNDRLAGTDSLWMRATGQGKKAEATKIEKSRQALRDIPQEWGSAIESAGSVEELASMWPEELE